MVMKAVSRNFLFGVVAASAWVSCAEQEQDVAEVITPVTVQFTEAEMVLNENETSKVVSLSFSRSASEAGTVEVELAASDLAVVRTEPALVNGKLVLPVAKGSTGIAFTLMPVNNNIMDGAKSLSASIKKVSTGFQIGANHSLALGVTDDEAPVAVNFLLNIGSTRENGAGATVTLALGAVAPADGSLEITYASQLLYGIHFTTEPAAANGKMTLPVQLGADHVSFTVVPANDQLFNGDRAITFTLSDAVGGVSKGQGLSHELTITDDELAAKGKGYEIVAGSWKYSRFYEYNEAGDLAKITWAQYTPAYQGGSYTYEYQEGRVHKMVENANRETYYQWEGNRIVKSEQYTNGTLTQYTEYGYDPAGNVGEAAVHYRQPNGELKLGMVFVYLYFTDGNLFKKMVYYPGEGSEEYALVATHTYDNYLAYENPFPAEEILPNVNSQPKLPGTYRVETNGSDHTYQFSYDFSEDGKPLSRSANAAGVSETATYQYY